MFGIINFEIFLVSGILLNITPGADTMYILGRSISQGKKSGVLSAIGIASGALVHCLFATLGLSLLLAQSAFAFSLIKYLGAAYLVYLGVKTILSKPSEEMSLEMRKSDDINYKKVYLSGILTNVLNPKVALFFLAFLPQFIDSGYVNNSLPFIILGLTFVLTGTIWCLILALFSAKLSDRIRNNYKIKTWLDRCTGIVFIILGIKLALSQK